MRSADTSWRFISARNASRPWSTISRCQHACTNATRLGVLPRSMVLLLVGVEVCRPQYSGAGGGGANRVIFSRMGNTWGHLFRVTTWGESHGGAVGAVVDGCPPRLPLSEADIQPDLDRRAPGQSTLVTQRK